MYLCWQNDNTILGVATSKKQAQMMCSEFGDSYMKIEPNVPVRENVDTTELCVYNIGRIEPIFKTYNECIRDGYGFENVRGDR